MLVAPFGVTVYRVVSVKGDDPRFVAVDGGMADLMEVALYGQRFEATVTSRVGGGNSVELVGRHCESGDRLISGVPLDDPRPGDLVAVAATGAYCYTMANSYNGAMRPPVVFCADGVPRLGGPQGNARRLPVPRRRLVMTEPPGSPAVRRARPGALPQGDIEMDGSPAGRPRMILADWFVASSKHVISCYSGEIGP
jgi:hypothetical protein